MTLEKALKKIEAENKLLDKANKDKQQIIEKMKENYKEQQALIEHSKRQWQMVKEQANTLLAEKKKLLIEKKHLINEKDGLAKSITQAKEETSSLAKELRESRNTVREIGLWWLLRVLYPRHLAIDCWFFVFCFVYLYNKII